MKKILLLTITLGLLISCSQNITTTYKGISFFYNQKEQLAIIKVDTTKANISFGGITIHNNKYDISKASYNFERFYAQDVVTNNKSQKKKILFAINGQFFNQNRNPTILSFPVKSNSNIISSYMDNELAKKTLIIDDKENIFIKNGFQQEWLKEKKYVEVIVGFSPEVKAQRKRKVGRTYIGKKNKHTLVFFIAKGKTTAEMETILKNYGIDNYLMMDGGPSSQFAWNNNGDMQQFFGGWEVPQFFTISEK